MRGISINTHTHTPHRHTHTHTHARARARLHREVKRQYILYRSGVAADVSHWLQFPVRKRWWRLLLRYNCGQCNQLSLISADVNPSGQEEADHYSLSKLYFLDDCQVCCMCFTSPANDIVFSLRLLRFFDKKKYVRNEKTILINHDFCGTMLLTALSYLTALYNKSTTEL